MNSVAELRRIVQEKVTPDTIVGAIIYKADESLDNKIPKSQAFLQKAFFSLKRESPDLFVDFVFDESGVTPFSDKLDSVLFRLEAATIFSTLNPTYKNYDTTNALELLKASYEKLESQKDEIDKCAMIFAELAKQQVD